jgi:hypothetical protein
VVGVAVGEGVGVAVGTGVGGRRIARTGVAVEFATAEVDEVTEQLCPDRTTKTRPRKRYLSLFMR